MKEPKLYKDLYQMSIHIFHRTRGFPKALRPTLGRKIEESSLNSLLNMRKATTAKPQIRLKYLYAVSESIDELRTLVQLSKELKAMNVAGFNEISGLTKEVGREVGGLIKYEFRKENK